MAPRSEQKEQARNRRLSEERALSERALRRRRLGARRPPCAGPQPGVFSTQQAAALAAGDQDRAWSYIEFFYHLQGDETTSYVSPRYLDALAKLVPGLNYSRWLADRSSPRLSSQVDADGRAAHAVSFSGTPSVIVKGKGVRKIAYLGDYATYEAAIKAVQ